MNAPSVLHIRPVASAQGLPAFPLARPSQTLPFEGQTRRRCKIWELSPSLHCSIVGTCLTAAELRHLMIKFGDIDARSASDHTLHKCGVLAAGKRDKTGKALQKLLDSKHEATIRQFSTVETIEEVRNLWREAFEQGAIPGGYWAMITHPATDRALAEEAFGQIHMLSHMIGSSNRTDIRRLRDLEKELADRDEKIERQQARLAESAEQRSELTPRIERLSSDLRASATVASVTGVANEAPDMGGLIKRFETEKARSRRLATRVEELEADLARVQRAAANQEKKYAQLKSELAGLERMVAPATDCCARDANGGLDLRGRVILYVGGRPGLVSQLKALCAERGGSLLAHDGGVEDSLVSLPGLASRADLVAFPVDCVSHSAVGLVRKACRDGSRIFLPLRTASVASFLAGVATVDLAAKRSDGCC